jgi:pyruvate oxidase
LNGLYDAAFDGAPVVLFAPAGAGGRGLEGIFGEIARHRIECRNDRALPRAIFESVAHAEWSNGVSVALVDWRALEAPAVAPEGPEPVSRSSAATPIPERSTLDAAERRLREALRPVVLAGRGARGAAPSVERIARILSAPIVSTMLGRGVVGDHHPHFAGSAGGSGHRAALHALEETDLLLVLGVSNRGALTGSDDGSPRSVQIDRHPGQLGRRAGDVLGLYGDVGATLDAICDRLEHTMRNGSSRLERERFLSERRAEFLAEVRRSNGWPKNDRGLSKPSSIAPALSAALDEIGDRAIIVGDVGLNTLWLYRYFVGDHDMLWSGSFATMGFALPAAIAVAETEPERKVIAMMGDGGFAITMTELETAVELGVGIVVVVFNNGKLGAIKFEQEVMGWPEFGSELTNANFAEFAEAAGAMGIRVTEARELLPALRRALAAGRPAVVDVLCDADELPSPPRIRPGQAAGYLVARLREARGSITRRVRRVRG